jgi:hypothetical protein
MFIFFKKKKREPDNLKNPSKIKKEYIATISIYVNRKVFKREYFSWDVSGVQSPKDKYKIFRGFIKWYHCRTQSKSFSMRYNKGVTVIERVHITGYNIDCHEVKH